ncbi:hypothetical protein PHYBLDRAFT_70237 [Phycomyces blakesleeanus NRRL 1555(-)]|uniref:Uncharacterized protein n=1 Tax=Phycomyces blakesleeanus (strain ATCC 8743b / DSM 1359 / FGSC 10004 / NBRC 33097 / NRRL 1555) TaxID=763407 RepID=A0A162WFD8_PHYB8|nr:hypothetical protein PHYBLDRAFT_70237 [Phycomyces blakesleeanus NRRL 1555(-)]OAD66775.1 hypothetical protein PHYBLDRAFT_70237 [Phycomyces blakesleeanus NRRL 1555(-)]|eukprot:XP_018284815.1 hypothetical protein PHYBLDRAFT_70237 [Phycomyces blakesleeanus NRRL 1555(-)]
MHESLGLKLKKFSRGRIEDLRLGTKIRENLCRFCLLRKDFVSKFDQVPTLNYYCYLYYFGLGKLYDWGQLRPYIISFRLILNYSSSQYSFTTVLYRHAWATRMMGYKQCMSDFTGEDEEIEVTPILLKNQKKLVMVTHDESTFYAHDGKVDMWLEEGESHIRKKGQGRSLMVSEFQCACHDIMQVKGWVSHRIFNVGAAYDSYWTREDMLDQLKNHAIPLFESLHKGCTGVFIFDQSSNHKAYATDALVATRMVLKPKVVSENDKVIFKDTTFLRDGRIIPQWFYETVFEAGREGKGPVEKRQFVSVQWILQERGLWMELDPSNLSRRWRMDCNEEEAENHCCCAHHLTAKGEWIWSNFIF